ncbi:MAG: hypothetical protein Q7U14_11580, partial [Lacisediminimonas sp.]|nr:hypothetical protein [Lacisediminimonas sp.]
MGDRLGKVKQGRGTQPVKHDSGQARDAGGDSSVKKIKMATPSRTSQQSSATSTNSMLAPTAAQSTSEPDYVSKSASPTRLNDAPGIDHRSQAAPIAPGRTAKAESWAASARLADELNAGGNAAAPAPAPAQAPAPAPAPAP